MGNSSIVISPWLVLITAVATETSAEVVDIVLGVFSLIIVGVGVIMVIWGSESLKEVVCLEFGINWQPERTRAKKMGKDFLRVIDMAYDNMGERCRCL